MIRKTIARNLASHLQRLQDGLEKYALHASKSRMHQLRVEMKSIRAVLFLLEEVSAHHKSKEIHREIKKMFSSAGQIRECQLEISWMHIHKKPRLLRISGRMQKLSRANRVFSRDIPENLRKLKKIGCIAEKLLKKSSSPDIHHYFIKLFERVQAKLHPELSKSQWHESRKLVKRLLFAGRWLAEERQVPAPVGRFLSDLDALQKIIGLWHDLFMLKALFESISEPAVTTALAKREIQLAMKKLNDEMLKRDGEVIRLLSAMHTRWNPAGSLEKE